MAKILCFTFRGEEYRVNEQGHISKNGSEFSKDWKFLGGTKHHWSTRIEFGLYHAFLKPSILNGCLGWDFDHGTVRQWGGRYNGKLPRIENAYLYDPNGGFKPKEFVEKRKA